MLSMLKDGQPLLLPECASYPVPGNDKRPKVPKRDLTALTWAHAVNSQAALKAALRSKTEMIEADIVLGRLMSDDQDIPIMAHPPIEISDLTLYDFLIQIIAFNKENEDDMKGVKLDFKSILVFDHSLHILEKLLPLLSAPVWLNADIISGPVNEVSTLPVNPDRFFAGCERFENVVLSIGWTTRWGPEYRNGAYLEDDVQKMWRAIKRNNLEGKTLTFPVRAGIAAHSQDCLTELLSHLKESNPKSTLTIWSSKNDYIDIPKLRDLILAVGVNRVYLDVPAEVHRALQLTRYNAKAVILPSLFHFGLISCAILLVSMWVHRCDM